MEPTLAIMISILKPCQFLGERGICGVQKIIEPIIISVIYKII